MEATTKWLEDRLTRLSNRQAYLERLLLTTLQPGERQKVIDERTIVTSEIQHAHKQINYVDVGTSGGVWGLERGYCMMIGGPDRLVRLWKSTNLLDWEIIGDIPNKAAECIDMYAVPVDGDPENVRWIISDAGAHYEIGEFDGKTWKGYGAMDADDRRLKFDYGDAWYAAQAFNQGPDGRVVHVGWPTVPILEYTVVGIGKRWFGQKTVIEDFSRQRIEASKCG